MHRPKTCNEPVSDRTTTQFLLNGQVCLNVKQQAEQTKHTSTSKAKAKAKTKAKEKQKANAKAKAKANTKAKTKAKQKKKLKDKGQKTRPTKRQKTYRFMSNFCLKRQSQ